MNKSELIDAVADATGLTKADAARALDATTDAIQSALQQGNQVSLVGFGTFTVRVLDGIPPATSELTKKRKLPLTRGFPNSG